MPSDNGVKDFYWRTYPLTFRDAPPAPRKFLNRYISAEIEVQRADSATGLMPVLKEWKCSTVRDGSLGSRGFEINTAPQKGENFPKLIDLICEELKSGGAKAESNCGLHVHIDTRDLTVPQLVNLIKLYTHLEPALFSLQPFMRRISSYCLPLNKFAIAILNRYEKALASQTNAVDGLMATSIYRMDSHIKWYEKSKFQDVTGPMLMEEIERVKGNKNSGHRYSSLNLTSHFHRGTVECRLHCGTTASKEIVNWGLLIGAIVEKAKVLTREEFLALNISPISASAQDSYGRNTADMLDYYGNLEPIMVASKWPSDAQSWASLLKLAPYGTKYYFSMRRKKFLEKERS